MSRGGWPANQPHPDLNRRCPVSNYTFPGYPSFLETAAQQIGRPGAEGPARCITTLSALANLCAQASMADPAHVPAIMAKAGEFRDQLHAAYVAAELMIAEVDKALRGGLESPAARPPASTDRVPRRRKTREAGS
jgi:hypothetical protein